MADSEKEVSQIIIQIINIVLPVFLITLIGYLFGKIKKINLTAINDFVIYVSTPCLILSSLTEEPLAISLAVKVFVSVIGVILGCLVIGFLTVRILNLRTKVYLPTVLFANTGNMGLPLVLFAFGDLGFNVGILYMISTTVLHYSLGIMILNYGKSPLEVFRLPLIYSAVLGVAFSVMEWNMPTAIHNGIDLLGEASIPMMTFALGYKLSEVRLTDLKRSFLFGGLRVGAGFIFGLVVVKMLDLSGVIASVVKLQSAMPPAVFNFVLAEKYKQDSQVVASIIMAGTLISIVTTPIIIAYLIR
ncbi:MAG TPA: AEC family transporter [Thermodesulfobacteriota bacterium]|nr:AEC family transporter [Thermodesulfobacteriota bacterium]